MANKKTDDERLERLMNQLADSVLSLSDEAILAEGRETGEQPDEQIEHTRLVLREASKAWALERPYRLSVENPVPRRNAPSLKR